MNTQAQMSESRCTRCKRPNPEFELETLPATWEVLHNGQIICESCITPAEWRAIDEDMMDLEDECGETENEYHPCCGS